MSRKLYLHSIEIPLKYGELNRTQYIGLSSKQRKEYRKRAKRNSYRDIWSIDYSENDIKSQTQNEKRQHHNY